MSLGFRASLLLKKNRILDLMKLLFSTFESFSFHTKQMRFALKVWGERAITAKKNKHLQTKRVQKLLCIADSDTSMLRSRSFTGLARESPHLKLNQSLLLFLDLVSPMLNQLKATGT